MAHESHNSAERQTSVTESNRRPLGPEAIRHEVGLLERMRNFPKTRTLIAALALFTLVACDEKSEAKGGGEPVDPNNSIEQVENVLSDADREKIQTIIEIEREARASSNNLETGNQELLTRAAELAAALGLQDTGSLQMEVHGDVPTVINGQQILPEHLTQEEISNVRFAERMGGVPEGTFLPTTEYKDMTPEERAAQPLNTSPLDSYEDMTPEERARQPLPENDFIEDTPNDDDNPGMVFESKRQDRGAF